MSMLKLAMRNVKSSFKNYLSLIVSLAFTVLIFLNFQNIIYSNIFEGLGGHNKEYIDIIIRVISFVLGCFMFFFIWYSTNVFLTKRKKEIGIYIFMGLTNQRIGKLYAIEMILIGCITIILGIGFGIITTQLFLMILLTISDISVEASFPITTQSIFITIIVFLIMYLIFVIKGYWNIVQSSVLSMVSATRQNEYVKQNIVLLWIKTIIGVVILGSGYYLAIKEGGQEVMGNVMAAVVLVVIGVYLLFGGFMPILYQTLAKKKRFLYQKERNLWINNVIFRMKKNYRTYAMVCVLMLCSVTALATGFAMKNRYQNIIAFRNTYTIQFLSNQQDLKGKARELIEKENEIVCETEIPILTLDSSLVDTSYQYSVYAVLSYSQVQQLAKEAEIEFTIPPLQDNEIVELGHLPLLSLITDNSNVTVTIHGKTYQQVEEISESYLGYLQESVNFYIVNDNEYEQLLPLGTELYTYNYQIKDIYHGEASRSDTDSLVSSTEKNYTARIITDPESSDIKWIRVLYTICIFMFMVFVLASGSILFMKLYNDAFEEKERYQVLKKIGLDNQVLKKSVKKELGTLYTMPFLIMAVSAYFSVYALEKMMQTKLISVYIVSVAIIFALFVFCYVFSAVVYNKNAGLK